MGKKHGNKKWGGSVADIVNNLNVKADEFKNGLQAKLADGENAIKAGQEGLNTKLTSLSAKGQAKLDALKAGVVDTVNNVKGTVEPSPQANPLATGLGGPAQGGRRRRTRKSKKSKKNKKSKKSKKSKRFTRRR